MQACWWTNSGAPAALLTLKSSGLSDCSANQLSAKTETQKKKKRARQLKEKKKREDRLKLWELIRGGNWQRPHDRIFKYLSYGVSRFNIHRSPVYLCQHWVTLTWMFSGYKEPDKSFLALWKTEIYHLLNKHNSLYLNGIKWCSVVTDVQGHLQSWT